MDHIAAGDSIPEWRLVPNDNNIGQRNVYPVSGGGTSGLTADFNRFSFELRNPHLVTAAMEVRAALPPFLRDRGWKVQFLNRGGSAFKLRAGESRDMVIRLEPGKDFTRADVNAAQDRTIELWGYAGGILVGGMSYEVDPNLGPPKGGGRHPERGNIGEEILKYIDVGGKKVREIRVRKVTVDIEIEDDDDC